MKTTFIVFYWLAVLVFTVLIIFSVAGEWGAVLRFFGMEEPEEIQATPIENIETGIERPFINQLIGISTKNRDSLIKYLKCRELLYGGIEGEPKLKITLKDWGGSKDAEGDSVVISYQTYADIPANSVKADCPASAHQITECWFIKYEDEGGEVMK